MQKDIKLVVTSLQSKIEKLILMHNKALEDNVKLQALVESLHQQIIEQQKQIEVLENEKSERFKSTNEDVLGIENTKYHLSADEIDEMLRDIDKCITLLSISKKNVETV
ncbi:MAG: hypothetical protein LC111_09445 [Bacteroidia bacterium]|nr:hypothetical protein [Bacteroidia bacterium]